MINLQKKKVFYSNNNNSIVRSSDFASWKPKLMSGINKEINFNEFYFLSLHDSLADTHPITNPAKLGLTSIIR